MTPPEEAQIQQLNALFRNQAYRQTLDALETLYHAASKSSSKAELRRLRGWVRLALGDTEKAYDDFWTCADHPGGRAGILALTVLAGQLLVAMTHWQRFCQSLSSPPLELPDAAWVARPVALAAVGQIQRYSFPERSPVRGAASLYSALLFQAIGDAPSAFSQLAKVADFYAPAEMVRDRWLQEVMCLPPPSVLLTSDRKVMTQADSGPLAPDDLWSPASAVQAATRLLLYPDPDVLERQCKIAIERDHWQDALEILDRWLLLDPNQTQALEQRWRLHLQLGWTEAAKSDLFALVEIYERASEIVPCLETAQAMVDLFPDDERTLLKMCFLQARLASPLALARHGRRLLALCLEQELYDRFATYRLWLLRQNISLDDRVHFESLSRM